MGNAHEGASRRPRVVSRGHLSAYYAVRGERVSA